MTVDISKNGYEWKILTEDGVNLANYATSLNISAATDSIAMCTISIPLFDILMTADAKINFNMIENFSKEELKLFANEINKYIAND